MYFPNVIIWKQSDWVSTETLNNPNDTSIHLYQSNNVLSRPARFTACIPIPILSSWTIKNDKDSRRISHKSTNKESFRTQVQLGYGQTNGKRRWPPPPPPRAAPQPCRLCRRYVSTILPDELTTNSRPTWIITNPWPKKRKTKQKIGIYQNKCSK